MAYDKVVDSVVLNAGLKQIADAIREKGGTSDNLAFPQAMADAIAAIESGGGAQPDWNAAEGEPGYVKNRTHWKESKTEVIPETSVEFASAEQPVQDPFILEIQEGSTYEVTWNGNVYQCVAYILEGTGSPAIGNATIVSMAGGNDEPFFIGNAEGETLVFAEEAGTHTVSISGETFTWHTLDKRYLPANLATTDDVQSVANDVANVANDVASVATTVNNRMDKTNPVGTGSFSMNRKAGTTIGVFSHAEGTQTTASGNYSHAEGGYTTASGDYSHAEGSSTTASGNYSHAEGEGTTASGKHSHAEGTQTTASGDYSHAEGSSTTASGNYSHAEGATTASGIFSHAEGRGTIAAGDYSHAQGKYNVEDTENKYAHIVGNGTDEYKNTRSNAHTLDWDGNAWFAGTVEGTAVILPSSTEGSTKKFKITVDDSGTLTATLLT